MQRPGRADLIAAGGLSMLAGLNAALLLVGAGVAAPRLPARRPHLPRPGADPTSPTAAPLPSPESVQR